MNNDKAYLMGLIIGGGRTNKDFTSFSIRLPYRRWGDLIQNPERAGRIADDILTLISPIFEHEYNLGLSYEPGARDWFIRFHGNLTALKADLEEYGLLTSSEYRSTADIEILRCRLHDNNLKRHFIAGLADTIGSLTRSHRRFTDGYQIVSFEFSGSNYKLVQQICQMLHEIECYPDQVLWNHPNQHSSNDAYYMNWKKGFKIRVLLDQYTQAGSFFSQAKMEGALENQQLGEGEAHYSVACNQRAINVTINAVHADENSFFLPPDIRGFHYIHTKHFCAVMGCPFAPREQIQSYLNRAENYISPFTRLTKGSLGEINAIVQSNPIMANRNYETQNFEIDKLMRLYSEDTNKLLWDSNPNQGYPVNMVLAAIAFVTAAISGNLNGKRLRGSIVEWLESDEAQVEMSNVRIMKPDCLTPLIIQNGDFASLVGPLDYDMFRSLIQVDDMLRLNVRDIVEDDLI